MKTTPWAKLALVFLVGFSPALMFLAHFLVAPHAVARPIPAKKSGFCSDILPVAREGVEGGLTVHVVVLNKGVVRLFENLLCSLHRTCPDCARVAVLAMDEATCPYLSKLPAFASSVCIPYANRMMQQMQDLEPASYEEAVKNGGWTTSTRWQRPEKAEQFGSVNHKVFINAKLYATRDVIMCGFASFTTDVDVVFFQDVLPFFNRVLAKNSTLTMLFQKDNNENNYQCDANTGFFLMLATESNQRFMTHVITDPVWWHIDQARINSFLKHNNFSAPFSWTLLPTEVFPVGNTILAHESQKKRYNATGLFAGHANWSHNLGRKFHMLLTVGWWFTDFSSHQCVAAGDPPLFDIRQYWPSCTSALWDCPISDR